MARNLGNLSRGDVTLEDHYQLNEMPMVPQSPPVQGVVSKNMIMEPGVLPRMLYATSVTARDTTAVSASPRLWPLYTLTITWILRS